MTMNLFTKVKAILRVTTEDPGILAEIEALIEAAKQDLITTGIHNTADPLFELAIMTYCKGHFAFDNPEADRFLRSYESIKQKMMNTKEYRNEK